MNAGNMDAGNMDAERHGCREGLQLMANSYFESTRVRSSGVYVDGDGWVSDRGEGD